MRVLKRLAIACAILGFFALQEAEAQSTIAGPPPSRTAIDANGVDVMTGVFYAQSPEVSIGQPGAGGLSYSRTFDSQSGAWRDNMAGTINSVGTDYTVTLFGVSEHFTLSGGVYTPAEGQASTLTFSSGTNSYTYTSGSGAVATFSKALSSASLQAANEGRLASVVYPSGEITTFTYTAWGSPTGHRLQSVNNNFGYQLKFEYENDTTGSLNLVKVTAINNAVDYCSPTASTCSSLSQTWPSLTFGRDGSTYTVTDALSRVTRFTGISRTTGIRFPTSGSDNITITYNTADRVGTVSNGVGTWTYTYFDFTGGRTTLITDPSSQVRTISTNLDINRVTGDLDALNRLTTYGYDTVGRLTRITRPEGDYTEHTYGPRGNVIQTSEVPKSGSGLSAINTYASYPSTCSNPVTCNLPTSTTDARGYVTDYTYNSTHGGVLTILTPDPDGGGSAARAQTTFTYVTKNSRYYVAPGNTSPSGPIYVLESISRCATATVSTCSGTANETRTTFAYPASASPNNLLPISTSSGAGNGSLTATVTPTYDSVGNISTIDGPLAGSADTTRFRYDLLRRQIGIVGPDPDGGGARKHPATRLSYHGFGMVQSIEQGTVDSQSDSHWAAFSVLQAQTFGFDGLGRRVRENAVIGGVIQSVLQHTYDSENRLECTAMRMNPATWSSLPGSACSLATTGSHGFDRITRITYNAVDEPIAVQTGYNTSGVRYEARYAYTPNGRVDYVDDANNNRSDFAYDGFDRLRRLYFPVSTSGASTANTSDYEEYGYDAASNLISLRVRSGETIGFSYDPLNRQTVRDIPGTSATDVYFGYDNLNRLLSARHASTGGNGVVFTYDALGRALTETSYGRQLASQYDLAGRRTRLTFPDSNYIEYTYDVAGAMDQVRQNGATSGVGLLADYAYDNLLRRTSLSRGNGTSTTFSYDTDSYDWTLAHNVAGTAQDLTLSFGYAPSAQLNARGVSNSAYAFDPPTVSRSYTPNGLNRYASVGGVTHTYDARGNLTSDGTRTFAYDLENRLGSVSGGASMTLAYDPLGRLRETVSGGATTQFLYDGDQLVAEYNGAGPLLGRYVHGAGVDEPLVWYEGTNLSSPRWLHADDLGTIIAQSDVAGAATPYLYGPYGEPSNWMGNRFRYTGQIALREVQLYHYKARAYEPALGRFLQTDPIGYAAGDLNLYAYVGNDPVNRRDPFGLQEDGPEIVVQGIRGRADTRVRRDFGIPIGVSFNTDIWDSFAPVEDEVETLRDFGCYFGRRAMFSGGREYGILFGLIQGALWRSPVHRGRRLGSMNMVAMAETIQAQRSDFIIIGAAHLHAWPGSQVGMGGALAGDFGFSDRDLQTAGSGIVGQARDSYAVYRDRAFHITRSEAASGGTGRLIGPWTCPN